MRRCQDALVNSLTVAFISTVVSTLIGSMLGLALYRYRFPGKAVFEGTVFLPIVIPEISMAVAMLAYFAGIVMRCSTSDRHRDSRLFTITVSHIAFSFPFVAVVVVRAWPGSTNRSRKLRAIWGPAPGRPSGM